MSERNRRSWALLSLHRTDGTPLPLPSLDVKTLKDVHYFPFNVDGSVGHVFPSPKVHTSIWFSESKCAVPPPTPLVCRRLDTRARLRLEHDHPCGGLKVVVTYRDLGVY